MTSTVDLRCDRSDLPASMCSHCRGLPWEAPGVDPELDPFSSPAPRVDRRGPWFTAAYPDACVSCGTDIIPGDTIRADGNDGYECAKCGEEPRQ